MQVAVGRYLIIFLLNFAIFGHVQSTTTPEYDWMTTPVCECNANGFRLISNHLLTGFQGKFAGYFTNIAACEKSCTLNYALLPCTGYFYEPNNKGKCTLFHHGVNTNVQSSPNGTAMLYVKCDQVSLKECTASTGGNTVATTTLSSGVFSVQPTTTTISTTTTTTSTTTTSRTTITTTPTTTTSITTTTQRSGGTANGTTIVTHVGVTGVTESGILNLFGAFHSSFPQILAEDITISCPINGNQLFFATIDDMQANLIECDNYLSVCYVYRLSFVKSRSYIQCITNVGITVICTYTDFRLRNTHCGAEFNDSFCEMTISCPKEKLVMTTANGEDLILLLANNRSIYQYDLSANQKLEIIKDPYVYAKNFVYGMDYWLKRSTIIWSTFNLGNITGKIYMCNFTKNLQFPKMIACDDNHTVLVEHNISSPYELAVDWIHGLLFWIDYNRMTINVMDVDTKQRKVLLYADRPSTIAVDPSKGLIFWTDYNIKSDPCIERASMDGNDRMTIVNSSRPAGIALDIFNERVYYANGDRNTIASVDYNGNDLRTILHSDTYINSLTIFEDKLYWTDYTMQGQGSVSVMNKFNGTEVRKLIDIYNSYSIRVYHSAVQPEFPNKCDQHSCGDGAICLPKGNSFDNEGKPQPRIGLSYSCVCADGYTTGKEPNTCVLRT